MGESEAMDDGASKTTSGTFSEKKYAVPFGRYIGSSEVQPPADEVLVGREGQRAYLIDLLISTGRRGAYLVTGRRGTGKTSFVKYCIAEYEASVFSRFLRGNVGKGVWDRALVLLFWFALLLSALLLSELIQIFNTPPEGSSNPLRWVALVPVGILLFYPCVYAQVAVEAILREKLKLHQDLTEAPRFGTWAAVLVTIAAAVAWFAPGLGKPVSVSLFIPIICGCYLFIQATSFETEQSVSGPKHRALLGVFLFLYLVLITFAAWPSLERPDAAEGALANLGLGAVLLCVGHLLRGCQQHTIADLAAPGKGKGVRRPDLRASLARAMTSGSRWYTFTAGLILFFGLGLPLWIWLSTETEGAWIIQFRGRFGILFGATAWLVIIFYNHRRNFLQNNNEDRAWRFRPSPYWALGLKSLLSILVALHLAYPILANLPLKVLPGFTIEDSLGEIARDTSNGPIFSSYEEKGVWLLTVLAIIVAFHILEYEWIVRPYLRSREDSVSDPSGLAWWEDWQEKLSRHSYRNLAELTLPWMVYKSWLPVLTVSVNLGFDRLGHRQVIQAMLVGLRERYDRTFLAWNSGFANLGRLIGVLVLLTLTTLVSGPRLNPPWVDSQQITQQDTEQVTQEDTRVTRQTSKQVTTQSPEESIWLKMLNYDLLSNAETRSGKVELEELFIFNLLPNSPEQIHFRIYHILVFILLYFTGRFFLFKIPLLPYRENLRRIDDLLDSLSVRTRVTSSLNLWGPARWVYSIFTDERVRETERDPVDPRTVELAFLQILEDVQKGGFRFPGAARQHLAMPAPEITFIFDELDKLGTRVDPDLMREPTTQLQESEVLYHERERSVKLRALLSDLKNILASAPARFIFVGGRDLHDEWLADQTSRQPLLTSIFNTEVYLPSLMTDHGRHPRPEALRLHRRTQEYLLYQHIRAHYLHHYSAHKRWRPSFGLSVDTLSSERFTPGDNSPPNERSIAERIVDSFQVIDCDTGEAIFAGEAEALLNDFALFLTHRSMGNPKKLKDLLAGFIRQAGREVLEAKRWQAAPCRHVLRFGDTEIFRMQLLGNIYRHLALAFEERMVRRDDKFAVSVFFLTDFLFKFHRRAFSWSNLERVDDLAHIHRLPDLRDLQEEIVNHFSERFLHRMLNGMYAFRFRSDIAREIEYLSRQSAAEMAVFNFTLDESQTLKAEYQASLKGWEEKNPDLVAALGELFEFDQDFEQSRFAYRRAIELLDKDLKELTARVNTDTGEYQQGAPIHAILAGSDEGLRNSRIFLAWGTARLRLMHQIGMTFEHARDYEHAETEYRSARTLARALVRAYVDWKGRGETEPEEGSAELSRHRLHNLKHMNIIFQPLFAEAWLSEKFVGAIDTSISLVEISLWELRNALPFVREHETGVATRPIQTLHANFALTISQLHNKAGDIYFFKGRQPVSGEEALRTLAASSPPEDQQSDQRTDGYLLRAHYHYAVGLHELRRYLYHRVESSRVRLSISGQRARTLLPKELPDLLFRAAAGGVNDMAEATLARVSLFGLFARLRKLSPDTMKDLKKDLGGPFEDWLTSAERDRAVPEDQGVDLSNWFGRWQKAPTHGQDGTTLIEFTGPDPAEERLAMSLKLCLVGASYFEKGGYPEDAGRELLQVCETVTRYLWWGHARTAIYSNVKPEIELAEDWQELLRETIRNSRGSGLRTSIFEGPGRDFWLLLVELATYALRKADSLFRESRYEKSREGSSRGKDDYVVGELIPAEALTLLCSLGISASSLLDETGRDDLQKLLKKWTNETDFGNALIHALQRHRYPIINRLNGIKVLVDAIVMKKITLKDKNDCESLAQALEWTEELLDLNTQYDAPLHFTPLLSGTTYALLWLRWVMNHPTDMPSVERVYRAAQRDLHNSEEMFTMRRAYYEAINDLYYLYDDFNDRQIHFNHAIQMAGAELTAVLKFLVDLRERVPTPLDGTAPAEEDDLPGRPSGPGGQPGWPVWVKFGSAVVLALGLAGSGFGVGKVKEGDAKKPGS
jgi:hypothetical protein